MLLIILGTICMLAGTSTLFFDAQWLHNIGGCLYFFGALIMILGPVLAVYFSDEYDDAESNSALDSKTFQNKTTDDWLS